MLTRKTIKKIFQLDFILRETFTNLQKKLNQNQIKICNTNFGNMAQICENCEVVTKAINRLRNCVCLCNKESKRQINSLK